MLRNYILGHTPPGTHFDDVIAFAEGRDDWVRIGGSRERGYMVRSVPRRGWAAHGGRPVIGEMHVTAYMGRMRAWYGLCYLLPVDVHAAWAFDTDGNLIDVFIFRPSGP